MLKYKKVELWYVYYGSSSPSPIDIIKLEEGQTEKSIVLSLNFYYTKII